MPTILAIESSCDDTGAAILKDSRLRANVVNTQKIHEQYGGVVPELAGRAHQSAIVPVVQAALRQAGIDNMASLSAIAATQGPGLMGSLLVGWNFARGLAQALNIPLVGVNHLEAHVCAHFIENPDMPLPFVSLLVSGGHTQLSLVHSPTDIRLLGHSADDAAGEAFDKAAKVLGLPYPGGPLIDKLAEGGNPHAYSFPRPRVPGLNYSFSGLKTHFLYFVRDHLAANPQFVNDNMADICASYRHAIVSYLLDGLSRAAAQTGVKAIGISGGVAANRHLRREAQRIAEERGLSLHIPDFAYCTDNAAMIAQAGAFKWAAGQYAGPEAVPYARAGQQS